MVSLNLDYWKTSDAHVNTHPGCQVYLLKNSNKKKGKKELCKISNRKAENKNMMQGKKFGHSQEKYERYRMAEWLGRKKVLWHIVKMRKHEM